MFNLLHSYFFSVSFEQLFNQLSLNLTVVEHSTQPPPNTSCIAFQMAFVRHYDLSPDRIKFNLFALKKIKFLYTHRYAVDNPVSIFIWIHTESVCHSFLRTELLVALDVGGYAIFRHFHEVISVRLLTTRNKVQLLQYKRILFDCKGGEVQIIQWIFCAYCVSVYSK